MKKLIETLVNIYKIEDLRIRILNTLGFLLIYRLGSFVVLPGVDSVALQSQSEGAQGIAALLNLFAGGAFSRASIFALGIMPYISASIVMQLLGIPFKLETPEATTFYEIIPSSGKYKSSPSSSV